MSLENQVQQEWTPEAGLVEAMPLRRSWKRGGSANSYDFSFEFEGATIYGRFPQSFAELEERQDAIIVKARAREEAEEKVERHASIAPSQDYSAERAELKERLQQIEKESAAFSYDVVQKCVVGWKGAPEPYSARAKAELPLEIINFFFTPIIEHARLSSVEARFLDGN